MNTTFDDSKEEKINSLQFRCLILSIKKLPWWLSLSQSKLDLASHHYFCLKSSSIQQLRADVRKWVITGTRCGSCHGILPHGGVVMVGTSLLLGALTVGSSLKTSEASRAIGERHTSWISTIMRKLEGKGVKLKHCGLSTGLRWFIFWSNLAFRAVAIRLQTPFPSSLD